MFRRNVRAILARLEIRPKEGIARWGLPGPWFYRVLSRGLRNLDKRSSDRLARIAADAGIRIEDLWNPALPPITSNSPTPPAASTSPIAPNWPTQFADTHHQLEELLRRREYDWLPEFISMLYCRGRTDLPSVPKPKLGEYRASRMQAGKPQPEVRATKPHKSWEERRAEIMKQMPKPRTDLPEPHPDDELDSNKFYYNEEEDRLGMKRFGD